MRCGSGSGVWLVLAAAGMVLAQSEASSQNEQCIRLPKSDFRGGDINWRPTYAKSDAECCYFCKRLPNCVAWTRHTDGKCYLKHTHNKPTSCDHCTAGYVRTRHTSYVCAQLPRSDFKGGDIYWWPTHTESDAQCCYLCERLQKCVAWTRHTDGKCYLKHTHNKPTSCDHCTAGYIRSRPTRDRCAYFESIDLRGGDILNTPIQTKSNAECCGVCQRHEYCAAWTRHTDGKCYLKGPLYIRVSCSSCTSGLVLSANFVENVRDPRAGMESLPLV